MNRIPPLDLTQQYQHIRDEVQTTVLEVLASGRYINGPVVEAFEQQLADYVGAADCVSCNSGTDALYLALRSLNIGTGDEVITTPFTFIATAETISAVGATPVFVDIDPATFNLDLEQIEAAITPKTKAIMPVHLFGQPVDMTRVMAIAQRLNLWVIEDCAQAIGASWQNQPVGSIGHIGCFSFYPTKNLGACGDGGAVTTQDGAIATQIRQLRNHGQPQTYIHDQIGVNSRLDAIQAAILSIKLRYLDQWNQQRQQVADRYAELLRGIPDIAIPQAIAGGQSVWNQYTLRISDDSLVKAATNLTDHRRDRIRQALNDQNISSMIYYPLPLHLQPVYASLGYQAGQLPRSEQVAQEVLSLPMFPELTPEQQHRIAMVLEASVRSPSALSA